MSWRKLSPTSFKILLSSLENCPSLTVESAFRLTFVHLFGVNPSVTLLFNFVLVFYSSVVSREVCTFWLQWLQLMRDQCLTKHRVKINCTFIFTLCFVKHWVLHEFSYLRAVKYTRFTMLIGGNFSWRKANLRPSVSIAFLKFFSTPKLICKGRSIILLFYELVRQNVMELAFNACLSDHSCLT